MTTTPIIRLEDIRKSYFMGKQALPVLKGVSLDIFKNEYVALMGPSGSGKSTLMNILGCLDSPTAGTYTLNGQDVSKMPDDDLADVRNIEIGFVFQQFNLLPRLTAAENVALPLVYAGVPKKERQERAMEVLKKVDLGERSHHKPNELSGGQAQRVAIARAPGSSEKRWRSNCAFCQARSWLPLALRHASNCSRSLSRALPDSSSASQRAAARATSRASLVGVAGITVPPTGSARRPAPCSV